MIGLLYGRLDDFLFEKSIDIICSKYNRDQNASIVVISTLDHCTLPPNFTPFGCYSNLISLYYNVKYLDFPLSGFHVIIPRLEWYLLDRNYRFPEFLYVAGYFLSYVEGECVFRKYKDGYHLALLKLEVQDNRILWPESFMNFAIYPSLEHILIESYSNGLIYEQNEWLIDQIKHILNKK